jgi:hypothetical protein
LPPGRYLSTSDLTMKFFVYSAALENFRIVLTSAIFAYLRLAAYYIKFMN